MACEHPIDALQGADGSLALRKRAGHFGATSGKLIQLPCGRCILCRQSKAQEWATRCVLEASLHRDNCFLTLTYDDGHLPPGGGLQPYDVKLFLQTLRRRVGAVRYLYCGEYGPTTTRPHYHMLVFGFSPADKVAVSRKGRFPIFSSPLLADIWGRGHVTVDELTLQSAAYCARYTMKKLHKSLPSRRRRIDVDTGEVFFLEPEFVRMSLKPGLAEPWFRKYADDVYPSDQVVLADGFPRRVPRYFDKLAARSAKRSLQLVEVKAARESRAAERPLSKKQIEAKAVILGAKLKSDRSVL